MHHSDSVELTAIVRLELDAEPPQPYRLPGLQMRSLLYVFDGQKIGAFATSVDGADFVPGSTHEGVVLTFWADEARGLVAAGSRFNVWYGGTVGNGVVASIGWANAS